jgi:4-diphosphocytidyl-2-C-methyl-D-erythritol kinase
MDTDLNAPWPAPAKLNRFLHVVGRRADGYHLLQTLFQFLDVADYLSFTLRDDHQIVRHGGLAELDPEQDLCVRAARLLQQRYAPQAGIEVRIDKRLPSGAGLGGGSSDAATTLVAVNHYWRLGLSLTELAELGLSLGADVPIFVLGQAAWAEGVGEQLTPVALDEPWFVVIVPACQVNTRQIFSDPDLTRHTPALRISAAVPPGASNDCEAVVFRRYPAVRAAAEWLSGHGQARMTGTGSCVFAAFPDREQAEAVLTQRPSGLAGFVSRGCNRSFLHQRLQSAIMMR